MNTDLIPGSLIEKLRSSERVVVFTGAGVSQESGIPTFRDTLTGLWSQFDPEDLATPSAFAKQRDLVWGWYEYRRRMVMLCEPNPAHRIIAALGSETRELTVITQNVDDLHERAGSQEVVQLHGSLFRPRCHACDAPYPLPTGIPEEPAHGWRISPPKCAHCGGPIRPGVVWFGEELPQDPWRQATEATCHCDVMFSVGTSSMVYPAASLPRETARRGACVIQINPQPTDLDSSATYNLHGKAGEVFEALWNSLRDEKSD